MLSGVAVPLLLVCSDGGGDSVSGFAADAEIVVMRVAWVVSADGGGGRFIRSGIDFSTCARQRKHSPLP
jgi:hypothetical protein